MDKVEKFIYNNFNGDVSKMQQYINEKKYGISQLCDLFGLCHDSTIKNMRKLGLQTYSQITVGQKIYTCLYCGKRFYGFISAEKTGRNKFCSKECRVKFRKTGCSLSLFRFDTSKYEFQQHDKNLGQYEKFNTKRRRQFVNKNKINHFFFSEGLTDEYRAYVYGVFIADGNIGRSGSSIYVRLGSTDFQMVRDINRVLKSKYKISHKRNKSKKDLFILKAYSPYLHNDLSSIGCIERKTYFTNYPAIEDPSLHRHFIRGVLDGDGSWYFKKDSLVISFSGNDKLLYGIIKTILKCLDIKPTGIFYPKSKMPTYCYIQYSPVDSLFIRDWLYKDAKIYNKRKKNIAYSYSYKYYTMDIARKCKVSRSYVSKLVKQNKITAHTESYYLYFTEEEFDEAVRYIIEQKEKNPSIFPKKRWNL